MRKIPQDEHQFGWQQLSMLPTNLSTMRLTIVASGPDGKAQLLAEVTRGATDDPVSVEGWTQVPIAEVESLALVVLLDMIDREMQALLPF